MLMQVTIPNFLDHEKLNECLSYYNADGSPKLELEEWKEVTIVPNKHHLEYMHSYSSFFSDEGFKNYFLDKVKPYINTDGFKFRAGMLRSIQIGGRAPWHSDHTPTLKEEVLAITIFLNEEWHLSWGGLYLYHLDGMNRFLIPKFNEANCLLSPVEHSISTIDKDAKAPRNSLQLFFFRDLIEKPKDPEVSEKIIKPKMDWVNRG